jgi:hypothetical protein
MINEVYNQNTKPHDWIEFYNTGSTPQDLTGMQLYVDGILVYSFPSVTLAPGQFYVVDNLNFGSRAGNFVLMAAGSVVDQMNVPGWSSKNSWGRIGGPPYSLISPMAPSQGKINKGQVAIPEFSDLLLPIAIMPFMLFVIRRAKGARAGKD